MTRYNPPETNEEREHRLHLLQRVREFSTRFGWRVNTVYQKLSKRLPFWVNQYTRRLTVEDAQLALRTLNRMNDEIREIEKNSFCPDAKRHGKGETE